MGKIVSLLTLCLTLIAPATAMAERFDIVYPKFSETGDPREAYILAVLDLAMKKASADYTAKPMPTVMERGRYLRFLETGDQINLVWTSMSADVEKVLLPVRIPLFRGLLGYRIALINNRRQDEFSAVKTLDDLKKFTAIQGLGWGDVKILSSVGIPVGEARYDNAFKMINANRVDFFPRGITEVFNEFDLHKNIEPNLAIEKHILIFYKSDLFFYTNQNNERLASVIKKGLLMAYEDGSFLKLFNEHPFIRNIFQKAGLKERTLIEIPNILLSNEDKAIPEQFWYH